jgi:arsenate reductase
MLKITIYYNPDCSKCRQTLKLINSKVDDDIQLIKYLDSQLTSDELNHITSMGIAAKDLIRTHEQEWKTLGLDIDESTTEELINAIISYPSLLQRPIVLANDKAVIARPPEKVLDIL